MTLSRRRFACGLAAAPIVLAACETPPPQPTFPRITFSHLPPFRIDAGALEIVERFVPTLAPPHVEHRMPVQPAEAAAGWARDRLVPAGGANRLVATVADGRVVEERLATDETLRGVLTVEQSERYSARVALDVALIRPDGIAAAQVSAVAQRARTVPEDISLNERRVVWFEMTEKLMEDLNRELERRIATTFAPYLFA